MNVSRASLAVVGCALFACAAQSRRERSPEDRADQGTLVRHAELGSGVSLLDALRARTLFEVRYPENECPRVVFRGTRSMKAVEQKPAIYVDGTRMANTCVLTQLSPSEVDSVVVYPTGTSARANLPGFTAGAILVYRIR